MEENRLPYETLKIGDTEYKLKISASSAIEIEKKTGKSLVAGMADFDKLETVTLYLWGALNRFQANIDVRKAQEIYDDYIDAGGDLSDMAEILFKALTVSGFSSVSRQKNCWRSQKRQRVEQCRRADN